MDLEELREAIRKEVRVFEAKVSTTHPQSPHPTAAFYTNASKAANSPARSNAAGQCSCAYCMGPHSPSACSVLTTSQARKDFIIEHKLCFNCLGRHRVSACTSRHCCCKCQCKHHTSLCSNTDSPKETQFETTVIHLHGTAGQLIPLTVLIVPTIAVPIPNVNQNSISNLPYLAGLCLAHCFIIRTVHHFTSDWGRPLLGCCQGSRHQRQWSYSNAIQAWVSPFRTTFHVSAQQPTSEPDFQQFWSMKYLLN